MRIILSILLHGLPIFITAQNIQLHYDLGKHEDGTTRNFLVGTFEMFRPDSLGYTFMFIDFEFNSTDNPSGVSSGYFEISREFYMPWFRNNKALKNLGVHLEYNDGSLIFPGDDSSTYGANVGSAWLGGFGYPVKLGGFTLNTMVLYKHLRGSSSPDFQITFAWFHMIWKQRITFSGFIDVWSQDDFFGNPENKTLVLYGEPQVWYNVTRNLSFGSEFKISKNFFPKSNRLEVFPTIAAKWNF
jgi:hypothetical protein